jgi:hypothetical protein
MLLVLALRIHVHIPMERQALQLTQIFTFNSVVPVWSGLQLLRASLCVSSDCGFVRLALSSVVLCCAQ